MLNMTFQEGSDKQAWILTLASSLACIIGSLTICLDLLVRKLPGQHDFDIKDKRFLVAGLGLGSGVLLFTALNKMLPEALSYLLAENKKGEILLPSKSVANVILMVAFIAGVFLCIMLNSLLHRLTPQSIVHCGEDHDEGHEHESAAHEESSHTQRDHQTPIVRDGDGERTPLIRPSASHGQNSTRSRKSFGACRHLENSECAGFTDPCRNEHTCCSHPKDSQIASSSKDQSGHKHGASATEDSHHHHVTEEKHNLMRIGLQTAIAISLHKLPEGAITFMSSHKDSSLGFSIFLALGIHNLVEGFTIAFPLYLAFGSRLKAIAAAILLGGLSQPLGALIAFGVTKVQSGSSQSDQGLDIAYGCLFAVTSGFMAVISVSSMLPQAFRNDSPDVTLSSACFFLGIAIIGFSHALTLD